MHRHTVSLTWHCAAAAGQGGGEGLLDVIVNAPVDVVEDAV